MRAIFQLGCTSLLLLSACGGSADNAAPVEGEGNASAEGEGNNAAPEVGNATAAPELGTYDPNTVPGMARQEDRGYILNTVKWPRPPVIPVCWESPATANPTEKDWVKQAVTSSWQANSAIRFIGWGTCAANASGIRIAVAEDGPHTKGLGTQLNRKPQGMVLNFTFRTWSPSCASSEAKRQSCIKSIGVHEFGHALAFAHEQNRPDTPGECTEPPQGTDGNQMLTPWDLSSVMNYCNPVYNNEGRLSPGDITSVRAAYGS